MKLDPLPERYAETRDALHQLAFFAMGPARYRAEGRMGLAAAPGGFGTPPFDGKVARVEGDMLVFETRDAVASQIITTVRSACHFFGLEYEVEWFSDFHDPPVPIDPDSPLAVDDAAARALGQWFDFGTEVLERLRSHGNADEDASEVQLWPEHFDPATELGDADRGRRASYGASPGDADHPEPYLYVAPWSEIDRSDEYWSDDSFGGSILDYADLVREADPVAAGLEFLLRGYRLLHTV